MTNNLKEMFKKLPPHLLILGALGLIFVIVGNPFGKEEQNNPMPKPDIEKEESPENLTRTTEASAFKAQMERELEQILSKVSGAGEVQVMLSVEGSGKLDLVKNIDKDQTITNEVDGAEGEREIEEVMIQEEVMTIREDGQQQPMALRELKPEIRGVVIVAEGGNNINVVKQLVRTANTLFGVPEHQIQVLPRSNK